MRAVQEALNGLGIPVYPAVWRSADTSLPPGEQYVVYTEKTVEQEAADDEVTGYRTEVRLKLWSSSDPTDAAKEIVRRMYAAGFGMEEMTDMHTGSNGYENKTKQYQISWLWSKETEEMLL